MANTNLSIFRRIWMPFFILTMLTVIEFVIAFTMPKDGLRQWIFIVMTIAKAFYIVAYFMHLKFEKINLIYTIVFPVIFLVYLLVLMVVEANFAWETLFG